MGCCAFATRAASAGCCPRWWSFPPFFLVVINLYRPAYINARHMSLIVFFHPARRRRAWLAVAVPEMGRRRSGRRARWPVWPTSTRNYFTLPEYEKGSASEMGAYLRREVQPGDLLLWEPWPWWRPFPGTICRWTRWWRQDGKAWARGAQGLPPIMYKPEGEMAQALQALIDRHRRIWVAKGEPDTEVDAWLDANAFRVREQGFESPPLGPDLALYSPRAPVDDRARDDIQHPTDVVFGERIRFLGYDVGQPLGRDSPSR